MSRSVILLLIFAASAKALLVSSWPTEAKTVERRNSRWLTYACSSKEGGNRDRNLLSRILTHPCNSNAKKSTTTTNDLYNNNSRQGSNTFINITLGIVAGVSILLGFLFITDRDTFIQVTGVEECKCSCSKPNIDGDDDILEPTPFEKDIYKLSKETQDYLAEKKDREENGPKRLLSLFWCRLQTKEYSDSDKYNIPWPRSEGEVSNVNPFFALWEDVRLRFFWKPTKKYSQRDKYDVNLEELRCDRKKGSALEDEIQYAPSSYESAEPGTVPW